MQMGLLLQDLKYAVRLLGKAPSFTAVAVLSLTLGIGANTTIFTMAKAFFLESVPVKDPAGVVSLYSNAQSRKGPPQEYLPTPYLNAVDYREKTNVFSGASVAIFTGVKFVISGKQTQQLFAELVNGNFFDVLGVVEHAIRSRARHSRPNDSTERAGLYRDRSCAPRISQHRQLGQPRSVDSHLHARPDARRRAKTVPL